MDLVVLAKVTILVMDPNVARVAVEERGFTAAIGELHMAVVSLRHAFLRHSDLGLKDWFECDDPKQQSDEREDRLRVNVNAHVSASSFTDGGTSRIQDFGGQDFHFDTSQPTDRPWRRPPRPRKEHALSLR
jgi:hypothetical protein